MTAPDCIENKGEDGRILLKILTAHFNSLVSAGSDRAILRQYSALLRFLKSQPRPFLESYARSEHRTHDTLPEISGVLQDVSLEELERLINSEAASRRYLERIASERFSVPRGSMRSFSNRQELVEKLRSLIDNERAHETIGAVARGQIKETPDG